MDTKETKATSPNGDVNKFRSELLPELGELELHKSGDVYRVYLPGGKIFTMRFGKTEKEAQDAFENLADFEIKRRGGKAGAIASIKALPEDGKAS